MNSPAFFLLMVGIWGIVATLVWPRRDQIIERLKRRGP